MSTQVPWQYYAVITGRWAAASLAAFLRKIEPIKASSDTQPQSTLSYTGQALFLANEAERFPEVKFPLNIYITGLCGTVARSQFFLCLLESCYYILVRFWNEQVELSIKARCILFLAHCFQSLVVIIISSHLISSHPIYILQLFSWKVKYHLIIKMLFNSLIVLTGLLSTFAVANPAPQSPA